ncbi:MAG: NAD(P)/FAD-dependent oxidoreductase, partial [Defluviitaleaceae bacterium]|nr:NAD(P)/FAD-dependent oxidoreductase [Defluviitaleaceae bacterium]
MFDITIIGCGIVGAAAAYELAKYNVNVVVLEKENDVAVATTKANSAIIHAGYDPAHGTLMAKLNVEGARLAKDICKNLDVPYRQCGALVLAFSQEEVAALETLLENGIKNGVEGLRILDRAGVLALEPGISSHVVAALYAPTTAIVSPWEYGLALAETAVQNGVTLHRDCEVVAIQKTPMGYTLQTNNINEDTGEIHTRAVINAAGLYADKIHQMANPHSFAILPDRGEYFLLDKSEGARVKHVIFQAPSKVGKGILVAPTVHGNLIVGPNSEPVDCRDNVATTAQGQTFVKNLAQKSVPDINFGANIRNFAGNRAKTDRKHARDFIIETAQPGFINLAGIASPGLSAAPAIAKMMVELLQAGGMPLQAKQNFTPRRRRVRFNELSPLEKAALVAKNPAYGAVVCRCETVTEGEINDALNAPIPPKSVDAVKRRCGPGMGRCQGGFCSP